MEKTDPGVLDIVLIAINKLARKKSLATTHLRTLYQRLRENSTFAGILTSLELWICIALFGYSLVHLFVGIRSKRLTLSLFICAIAFECLSVAEDAIFRVFSACLDYLFKGSRPAVVSAILSNKNIPVLITSIAATLVALSCLAIVGYIVCGIVAFELYHIVDNSVAAGGGYRLLLICSIVLVVMLLFHKVFSVMLNTALALLFSSNGSYLFWTIASIMTGYPQRLPRFRYLRA